MSATTAGAVKAHLEAQGTGIPWFRDLAPKGQALPFGVIQEGISYTPVATGDAGDPTAELIVDEAVQVAVYQAWRGADGRPAEDYTLPDKVMRALHRHRLRTAPTVVTAMTVTGQVRLLQVDGPESNADPADRANVVGNVFTVTVRREV